MPPRSVAQVLADTGPILLDFDGPVCAVFASNPAAAVAEQLRQVLTDHGAPVPQYISEEADPLEVLRYAGSLADPRLTAQVDDQLRTAELEAIAGAEPAPYAREFLVSASRAGRPVVIVSNNSEPAIRRYLTAHAIADYVDYVVGRAYADPEQMKPDPRPLRAAVAALESKPEACVMIGDTPTDIQAAHTVGALAIGYANQPGKLARLAAADAIISTMREAIAALAQPRH